MTEQEFTIMILPILGIDIAKLKFNLCLINLSGKLKHKVFPNTATGFEQLREWLSKHAVERVHACLEATGTYGEALRRSICTTKAIA
jgi:transposase